jgi:hypothetical protein
MSNRYARTCLEDAISYARERIVFGKRLADQPVMLLLCFLILSPVSSFPSSSFL